MRYKINNLSEIGIVRDLNANELPDNAFSNGQNVRFLDGRVVKHKGHRQVFTSPPIAPYWMHPFNDTNNYYWILAGQTKLYATDMAGSYFNITRQSGGVDSDYSANYDNSWNGGVLMGALSIINNGVDVPQSWSGSVSDRAENLKYDASRTWADVSYTARVIRPFKTFLVAMDITKASVRYTNLVKWSSSANVGQLPDSWDESDETLDAGETPITESAGFLKDGIPLGDSFIIYGEDSTHIMQYIGGPFVFRFARLFSEGIISRRCVQQIKQFHVVLSPNDLIIHDGTIPRSIINQKNRSWLFNNIDPDNYQRAFLVPNYRESEIWVCFPQVGSSLPDTAFIWNYNNNSFGVRDLPNTPHISYGIIDPQSSQVIDDNTNIIDLDTSFIDERAYNPTIYYPLIASTDFYQADATEQFNGTDFTSYIERTGLTFGTLDNKNISRIIPKISGSGTVTIKLGTQSNISSPISWTDYTFSPGDDYKIDTRKTGRYIAYRVESTENNTWDMSSIEFEFTTVGSR